MEPLTLTYKIVIKSVTHPTQLAWWEWVTLFSTILPAILLTGHTENTLAWAIAVHLLCDFPLQTNETSLRKGKGEPGVILYHSFIAGGYPGLVAAGLPGLAVSFVIHWIIDSLNKFGLTGLKGGLLDQSLHILTLSIIYITLA